jgi:hypothetical protein
MAMTHRFLGLVLAVAVAAVALCIGEARLAGQGAPQATEAAAAAATPRLPDGRPDLNGYWYRRAAPTPVARRVGASLILDPTVRDPNRAPTGNDAALLPGTPKYKPEFLAKVKDLDTNQVRLDPAFTCGPPGVPRIGPPQRIVQTAREVVLLYDDLNGNFFRLVPVDGRPHRPEINPSAHGDSVGRWEGDTLVIDVRNLSAETWLGDNGLFHTDNLRVTERLTRVGNTITWQAIVEDPAVLAEPWKVNPRTLTLRTDEIEEAAFCEDRIQPFMQDLSHHGNTR